LLLVASLLTLMTLPLRAADKLEIMPLDQIKPGMTGEAYTIFAGDQIEKFEFTVVGILPNLLGPRQSVIMVQLHGPKVEHTGVVAGMSGSPVYIGGKLVGALSLKFGLFAKEPMAGVTPIEDMLALPTGDAAPAKAVSADASESYRLDGLGSNGAQNVDARSFGPDGSSALSAEFGIERAGDRFGARRVS
jgi:hypothetical protein